MEKAKTYTEAEDMLTTFNVFVNGITGKPSHSDSYMTVLDFTQFEKAWTEIKDKFSQEDWLSFADYWENTGYLSPVLELLGRTVKRKFNIS